MARLRTVLPTRWFPDSAPVLDGLLSGLASGWSWAYQLLRYVKAQTRIATATDVWLDIIANDYFGDRLARRAGQSDGAFRNRIQRELFRERGTRGAIIAVLHDLTGRAPLVFEPARTTDTGGYASLTGAGGGGRLWQGGRMGQPDAAIPMLHHRLPPGRQRHRHRLWLGWFCRRYGRGAIEYASLEMVQGQVTDADIYAPSPTCFRSPSSVGPGSPAELVPRSAKRISWTESWSTRETSRSIPTF